jgi:hypothetical protein
MATPISIGAMGKDGETIDRRPKHKRPKAFGNDDFHGSLGFTSFHGKQSGVRQEGGHDCQR